MKKLTDLKPMEKANRCMTEIDLSDIYFYNCPEEDWVYKLGPNGLPKYEYKTWQYYTYNVNKALLLIERNYAIWAEVPVEIAPSGEIRYNIDTLRIY